MAWPTTRLSSLLPISFQPNGMGLSWQGRGTETEGLIPEREPEKRLSHGGGRGGGGGGARSGNRGGRGVEANSAAKKDGSRQGGRKQSLKTGGSLHLIR